jgi:hypothetical protein
LFQKKYYIGRGHGDDTHRRAVVNQLDILGYTTRRTIGADLQVIQLQRWRLSEIDEGIVATRFCACQQQFTFEIPLSCLQLIRWCMLQGRADVAYVLARVATP